MDELIENIDFENSPRWYKHRLKEILQCDRTPLYCTSNKLFEYNYQNTKKNPFVDDVTLFFAKTIKFLNKLELENQFMTKYTKKVFYIGNVEKFKSLLDLMGVKMSKIFVLCDNWNSYKEHIDKNFTTEFHLILGHNLTPIDKEMLKKISFNYVQTKHLMFYINNTK